MSFELTTMNETVSSHETYSFLTRLNLSARGGTTDHVQAVLRTAILTSELPPGALINKHALCDRLGVSRFPVSGALSRLQAEGLVEILPQRGTRVTRIPTRDLHENIFIRRALEIETVKRIAAMADDTVLAQLERNLAAQTVMADLKD